MSTLQAPRLIRWIGSLAIFFLVVMTVLRFATHAVFASGEVSLAQTGAAFWLGLRYDARVAAITLLPLLVLGGVPIFNPFRGAPQRRAWLTLLGLAGAALIVFYISDFIHFRYLGQRLNATVLGFFGDARLSAAMVWQSYPVLRLVAIGVAAFAAYMAAIIALHRRTPAPAVAPGRAARIGWFAATLAVGIVAAYGRVGQYPLRWSDAFNLRDAASAQLALNPVESFVSSLNFRNTGFGPAEVREHYARMSAYLGGKPDAGRLAFERVVAPRASSSPAGSAPASSAAPARRPNIVLVICESFSGYKSSMWGNPLDTTPFFASLAKEGVFFDNCFTPHFGTARGVWATITGTPDVSPVETASRNPAMVDQHTIIADFAGHEKFYFLGGSLSWANIRGVVANNIVDLQIREDGSYDSPRVDVWGISDKSLFLEADKVLRARDTAKPFFAVIQTAGNHRPYTIPKEDLGEFQRVDLAEAEIRRHGFESLPELNAFRYTDHAFRKFMEAARRAPYFDDTIFVFVGDHGIGGNAGPLFPPAWTEKHLTRYHVPLLFYAPKLLAPRRIHSVASMVDVLPTIAGLADVPYRNRTFGRDLLRQQDIDGGASNVAFIIDHNDKTIGVVKQQHYGVQRIGGRHEVVWADFAAPPGPPLDDAERAEYATLARAFHETARYLLLNNPKTSAAGSAATVAAGSAPR